MVPIETAIDIADKTSFNVFDLSSDGRFVAALILDPPDSIVAKAEAKGGENRTYRNVVRQFLKERNWSQWRIEHAFNEVSSSLG
jgi:hypothetical protein